MYSQDGQLLTEKRYRPGDLETSSVDPNTGELLAWDWEESGTVEMNCFLCHTPKPNNNARADALQSGSFKWANTATLVDSGLVMNLGDS